MSIDDLVRDEINAEMLARLASRMLPLIESDEHTATEYATKLNCDCDSNTAKDMLDDEVKAGRMTCRQVRAGGRKATAYRVV